LPENSYRTAQRPYSQTGRFRLKTAPGPCNIIWEEKSTAQETIALPPSCHARASHYREARIDVVAGIVWTDADKIAEPAKPPIPTDQRAQTVAAHKLVAIKMG